MNHNITSINIGKITANDVYINYVLKYPYLHFQIFSLLKYFSKKRKTPDDDEEDSQVTLL